MKNKKCPCEECISLAMCYHRREVECEILYRYVCNTYVSLSDNREKFSEHSVKEMKITESLYKREILGTDFNIKTTIFAGVP